MIIRTCYANAKVNDHANEDVVFQVFHVCVLNPEMKSQLFRHFENGPLLPIGLTACQLLASSPLLQTLGVSLYGKLNENVSLNYFDIYLIFISKPLVYGSTTHSHDCNIGTLNIKHLTDGALYLYEYEPQPYMKVLIIFFK